MSLVKYAYKACTLGFYWPKYTHAQTLLMSGLVNLLVHGTYLNQLHFLSQIASKS